MRTATVGALGHERAGRADLAQAQSAVDATPRQQLASDQAQLTKDKKSTSASAQSAVDQDADKISSDQTAVQTAVANVATTKLKNTQSLHSAQNQLAQAKLQQQSNAAPTPSRPPRPSPATWPRPRPPSLQAQIQLAQARKALRETTLRAPVSGVVATVDGSVGDTVSGGRQRLLDASSSSSAADPAGPARARPA